VRIAPRNNGAANGFNLTVNAAPTPIGGTGCWREIDRPA
jgi:hypothetical protein